MRIREQDKGNGDEWRGDGDKSEIGWRWVRKGEWRYLRVLTRSRLSQPQWIAARYVVMGEGKKGVGIAGQFPRCSYTVGPYGSGPTGNYTIYLYIVVASEYTTLFS